MSRDYHFFLQDILTSCEKVMVYTDNLSREQFFENDLVYDATLRNIEIIGEASKQIPTQVRNNYPQVEWRKISGMRDIVVHVYFGIDHNIVWDVISNKIPELLPQIKQILHE
ncbi:MAG: DUF86 domain-containing protein [Chloroflexi bacterium]|nr:DUF86 domain-containing protein [Chloroflexota bacterium]